MLGFDPYTPNLPACSDFHPGCPDGKGVVTATFGHIQRNRDPRLGPSQPSPLTWPMAASPRINVTRTSCALRRTGPPPSWPGRAGDPTGRNPHFQAALIPQRADLRGPLGWDCTQALPWAETAGMGVALTVGLPGAPSSMTPCHGGASLWSWGDIGDMGYPGQALGSGCCCQATPSPSVGVVAPAGLGFQWPPL